MELKAIRSSQVPLQVTPTVLDPVASPPRLAMIVEAKTVISQTV